MKKSTVLLLFTLFLSSQFLEAQSFEKVWKDVSARHVENINEDDRKIVPQEYRLLELDLESVTRLLSPIAQEVNRNNTAVIELPTPDGSNVSFTIHYAPVMASGLAAKYPNIKTFKGFGTEKAGYTVRLDYTHQGFHASVFSPDGNYYIDPYAQHNIDNYICYFLKDHTKTEDELSTYRCDLEEVIPINNLEQDHSHHDHYEHELVQNSRSGGEPVTFRTYRLALATTYEYGNYHGGTLTSITSAVTTAVNRINQVFEVEAAINVELIDNSDEAFFMTPNDGYTNGNTQAMINENPGILFPLFGAGAFDIGHVLGTNAGGLAQLRSVCQNGQSGDKARGVTCHGNPIGDGFYIDYICHEMGHQFGANHTFNNCFTNNDGSGNENSGTAFEPGSGSTIMSYSGLCGSNNISFDSHDNYHAVSLNEIYFYMHQNGGNGCPEKEATSNTFPFANIPLEDDFFIPILTPFELTGEGWDNEGDPLSYSWEQMDLGPKSPLGEPSGNSPLFRTFSPDTARTRTFPRMNLVTSGSNSRAEVLPEYSRDMNFRFIVRDNSPEGGVASWDDIRFKATESAGPFVVTSPHLPEDWTIGEARTITWDVANTDNSPVNCQNVNIKLSLNTGITYPIMLLANTPNDGEETIFVPNHTTAVARVRVEAADNIFFDVSNFNFKIIAPTSPNFTFDIGPRIQDICLPASTSFDLTSQPLTGFDGDVNLSVVSGLPAGATASFSANPMGPDDQASLNVDMNNVTEQGTFEVEIMAWAEGIDTTFRTVVINTVTNDFSSFEILTPVDGSEGVGALPSFTWQGVSDAEFYQFELATNPAFGFHVVESADDITSTSYTPQTTLEENTLYYWRVRPHNSCGKPGYTQVFAFHTETLVCQMESNDTDIFISAGGQPTIESTIVVPNGGNISDVNVPFVSGLHEFVGDISVKLISPQGTIVNLWTKKCFNLSNFNLGFDDSAPEDLPCPLTSQMKHIPEQPLSAFNNQNAVGPWKLQIKDHESGAGGALTGWSVEICSFTNAENPTFVTNNTLTVQKNESGDITQNLLHVQDNLSGPEVLIYRMTRIPAHGTIYKNGQPVQLGGSFTQKDIDDGLLSYGHEGANLPDDNFLFTVEDEEGGWLPISQFNINIDGLTAINDLDLTEKVVVYPNPASKFITVEFLETPEKDMTIELVNMQGQIVRSYKPSNSGTTILNTSTLSDGMYLVQFVSTAGKFTQKIVITQ